MPRSAPTTKTQASGRKKRLALPGRRVWMTRGLDPQHHSRLRKVAAFLGSTGTMQQAHDKALEAGLAVVEAELGIPQATTQQVLIKTMQQDD